MLPTPSEPHERLKLARKRWQISTLGKVSSAGHAAKALGIAKGTYGCLENGWRSITWETAEKVASRFRVTPEWILSGRGTVLPHSVNKTSQSISIVYASDTSAFRTLLCGNYLESERQIVLEQKASNANGKKDRRLVGVETEDDAMARDKAPSYGAGGIIIFDPNQTPQPGNVVWAYIASRNECVIREYARVMAPGSSAPAVVLRAYNPSYESIPFDEAAGDKIGGVYDPKAARLAVFMQA